VDVHGNIGGDCLGWYEFFAVDEGHGGRYLAQPEFSLLLEVVKRYRNDGIG
jgi:hypothetical protein